MTEHPILFYFGNTHQADFPLIAVIAREANTDLPIVQRADVHDFRDYPYPKAQPWHMAYALIAESVGMTESSLKSLCIQRNNSPLVFANAHELGITATTNAQGKKLLRDKAKREAKTHLTALFALENVMPRVKLVITSGHELAEFDTAKQAIRQECSDRKIDLIEIPFFFMPNKAKINLAFTEDNKKQVQKIMSEFTKTQSP